MTNDTSPHRPRSVLQLLDESFWLVRTRAGAALLLFVLLPAPIAYVTDIAATSLGAIDHPLLALGSLLVAFLPYGMVLFFCDVWFVTLLFGDSEGRSTSLRSALRETSPHTAWILLTGLALNVLILLGMIFLVVPGIYLLVALMLAAPVGAIEGTWWTRGMRRSAELMGGHKRRVLGAFAAYLAASLGLALIFDGEAVSAPASFWAYHATSNLLEAWASAFALLAYVDIRIRDEGYDIERLADDAASDSP